MYRKFKQPFFDTSDITTPASRQSHWHFVKMAQFPVWGLTIIGLKRLN